MLLENILTVKIVIIIIEEENLINYIYFDISLINYVLYDLNKHKQPAEQQGLEPELCAFQLEPVSEFLTLMCVKDVPAGEDAGRGEQDDGHWVGGTQQPVAVEGRRDLLSQLLAQRHPGGRGQLPAIGKHGAAQDVAPRGIQGPAG